MYVNIFADSYILQGLKPELTPGTTELLLMLPLG